MFKGQLVPVSGPFLKINRLCVRSANLKLILRPIFFRNTQSVIFCVYILLSDAAHKVLLSSDKSVEIKLFYPCGIVIFFYHFIAKTFTVRKRAGKKIGITVIVNHKICFIFR
ncbi:hypothetical protein SDC9_77764 [bioreactor metagenome]|uniref:Uncharacterized protein n=1 Tax=bioreactor metagenome TaxID=1076179 RepID=A0A644YRR0_9ZZZZ